MTEMVTNARYIADAVQIPVICDADTGYGNPLNCSARCGNMNGQAWPPSTGRSSLPEEVWLFAGKQGSR